MQQRKTRRGETRLSMHWLGGSGHHQRGDCGSQSRSPSPYRIPQDPQDWPWDPSIFIFSPVCLCPAAWTHQVYSYLRTFALPSFHSPRSKHGSDLYRLPVSFQRSPPQRGLHKSLLCLKELQDPLCLVFCFISLLVLTSIWLKLYVYKGFPGGSDGKASACSVTGSPSIPELGRSPGEENGKPFQYSCLENSMDRGAWQATVHGVTKSWTWLSNQHFHMYINTQRSDMDNSQNMLSERS